MNSSAIAIKQARFNMIEQQIRTWDVLDERVLALLNQVPREDFVPENEKTLAFADTTIPLAHGQVMMQPKIEARLIQTLNIVPSDAVLEIGTGSGYLTALLAASGKHVYSIDVFSDFIDSARDKLSRHDIQNVTLETGDGSNGWDKHGPYDVVAVTGSLPILSDVFQKSLKIGGRLFIVIGEFPIQEALLIRRIGAREWHTESLFETYLPPLINAPQPQRFVF